MKDEPNYSYKLSEGQFGLDVSFSPGDMEINESEMSVVIPYADGKRRDGVGDLLEVGGIDTERHKQNPIVLFDHGKSCSLPIALAENPDTHEYTNFIDPINKIAKVKAFFYQGKGISRPSDYDHSVFCEQIFDLIAKKYIRAGSIGYQVKKAQQLFPDYEVGTPQGLHLLQTLMLEASAVVLPCNQDTVIKMLSLPKVCGKKLSPYLVKSLTPYAPRKKAQLGYEGGKGFDEEFNDPGRTASLNEYTRHLNTLRNDPKTAQGDSVKRRLGLQPNALRHLTNQQDFGSEEDQARALQRHIVQDAANSGNVRTPTDRPVHIEKIHGSGESHHLQGPPRRLRNPEEEGKFLPLIHTKGHRAPDSLTGRAHARLRGAVEATQNSPRPSTSEGRAQHYMAGVYAGNLYEVMGNLQNQETGETSVNPVDHIHVSSLAEKAAGYHRSTSSHFPEGSEEANHHLGLAEQYESGSNAFGETATRLINRKVSREQGRRGQSRRRKKDEAYQRDYEQEAGINPKPPQKYSTAPSAHELRESYRARPEYESEKHLPLIHKKELRITQLGRGSYRRDLIPETEGDVGRINEAYGDELNAPAQVGQPVDPIGGIAPGTNLRAIRRQAQEGADQYMEQFPGRHAHVTVHTQARQGMPTPRRRKVLPRGKVQESQGLVCTKSQAYLVEPEDEIELDDPEQGRVFGRVLDVNYSRRDFSSQFPQDLSEEGDDDFSSILLERNDGKRVRYKLPHTHPVLIHGKSLKLTEVLGEAFSNQNQVLNKLLSLVEIK